MEELLRAIRRFSEYIPVHFKDVYNGYKVERDIDSVVLRDLKLE